MKTPVFPPFLLQYLSLIQFRLKNSCMSYRQLRPRWWINYKAEHLAWIHWAQGVGTLYGRQPRSRAWIANCRIKVPEPDKIQLESFTFLLTIALPCYILKPLDKTMKRTSLIAYLVGAPCGFLSYTLSHVDIYRPWALSPLPYLNRELVECHHWDSCRVWHSMTPSDPVFQKTLARTLLIILSQAIERHSRYRNPAILAGGMLSSMHIPISSWCWIQQEIMHIDRITTCYRRVVH